MSVQEQVDEWTPRIQRITDPIELLEEILKADELGQIGGDPYYHDIVATLMLQAQTIVDVSKEDHMIDETAQMLQKLAGPGDSLSAKLQVIHVVIGNTDNTEGRGRSYVMAAAEDSAEAQAMAQKNGVMGTNAPVERRVALVVQGDEFSVAFLLDNHVRIRTRADVANEEAKERLRKSAYGKLTPDERKALGLEKP